MALEPRFRSIPQRIADRAEKFGDKADQVANIGVPFLYALAGIVLGVPITGRFFKVAAPWWLFIVALALIVVAALWQWVQVTWRNDVARKNAESVTGVAEQIESRHRRLSIALIEVAAATAGMPSMSKPDRVAEFKALVKQLVQVPRYVTHRDVAGVRAVVYEVGTEDVTGARRMDPIAFAKEDGVRADPTPFTLDTRRGELAFETLESGSPLFVDDIAKESLHGKWEGSGRDYNTFITVPITDGTTGYGLFTVDAPNTDDLTEADKGDFGLIASLLAIIFAERDRKTPGPTPGSRPTSG